MQLLLLADGRLQVKYKSDFHDNSGRHDLGSKEVFVRGNPPQLTQTPIRNLTPERGDERILQFVLPSYLIHRCDVLS